VQHELKMFVLTRVKSMLFTNGYCAKVLTHAVRLRPAANCKSPPGRSTGDNDVAAKTHNGAQRL
jgi:hypothetical protein